MIDCVSDAHGTLVTICNYEKYQDIERVGDAPVDAHPTHIRRTADAQLKEGKKEEEDSVAYATDTPKRSPRSRIRLPEDWQPGEVGWTYALSHGIGEDRIQEVFEHFRNHHTGKGTTMASWPAACRRVANASK